MTVEHRFECALCGHRIHGRGEDSEAARQRVREAGGTHLANAHADRLASTPRWPDDPAPDDLLSGETAYGSLRGLLVPADDLLVCADCGYSFAPERSDPDRTPVGEPGLVCSECYERRVDRREESVADAIEAFVR
ncbi:hypothetical protein [Halorussus halobius]|uniref:hypothetical protein n=1 Tax=Halorussus halobius TaxID=1710537 RepID=UPI0010924B75|nr:hypothetical protein [Halorussus halobius]